jgi:tRNA (cmo5U34)-methyltransferase
VADVLPFSRTWKGQILDIAAGQGVLSEVLLRRFPRCRITLLDSSTEMLAIALQKLATYKERTSFVLADFLSPDWQTELASPYDAVVSSLGLHYLSPDIRPTFFRSVYNLLQKDGWFVDADLFDCECSDITERMERVSARYAQRQMRLLRGECLTLDEMVTRRSTCSWKSGHRRSTVAAEIAHLKRTGFSSGCIWQQWCLAVIAAKRSRN